MDMLTSNILTVCDDINHFVKNTYENFCHASRTIINNFKNNTADPKNNALYWELIILYEMECKYRRPTMRNDTGFDGRLNESSNICLEAKTVLYDKKNLSIKLLVNEYTLHRYRKYPCFLVVNVVSSNSPVSFFKIVGSIPKKLLKVMEERYEETKDNKTHYIRFTIEELISYGFDIVRETMSEDEVKSFLKFKIRNNVYERFVEHLIEIPKRSRIHWTKYFMDNQ